MPSHLKKKSRIAHHKPLQSRLDTLDANTYRNIIQNELHRLQSPVIHINPAAYSPAAIQAIVDEANLREGY